MIWTTTPWTLPANEAVALNPDFDYVLGAGGRHGAQILVLAAGAAPACLARYGEWPRLRRLAASRGASWRHLRVEHPFGEAIRCR